MNEDTLHQTIHRNLVATQQAVQAFYRLHRLSQDERSRMPRIQAASYTLADAFWGDAVYEGRWMLTHLNSTAYAAAIIAQELRGYRCDSADSRAARDEAVGRLADLVDVCENEISRIAADEFPPQ